MLDHCVPPWHIFMELDGLKLKLHVELKFYELEFQNNGIFQNSSR